MTEFGKEIVRIFGEACALDEDVTEESRLKELSLDSLSFISALVRIEDETGLEFELEELNMDNWETVGDFIKGAEEKSNEIKRKEA